MKRIIFILVLLLSKLTIYGQTENLSKYQDTVFIKYNKDQSGSSLQYGTDTIVFASDLRRHILKGTTFLQATHNSMAAMEYGITISDITKSECKNDHYEKGQPDKINTINMTDSTLTVDINITDNCCYDFLGDISVDSTGTLDLIYTGYGSYCFCSCCFGLTYRMNLEKLNDIPEIKYIMINGDRNTIKEIKRK